MHLTILSETEQKNACKHNGKSLERSKVNQTVLTLSILQDVLANINFGQEKLYDASI